MSTGAPQRSRTGEDLRYVRSRLVLFAGAAVAEKNANDRPKSPLAEAAI